MCCYFFLFCFTVHGQGSNFYYPPVLMVSHYPETGSSSDLYIYAINRFGGEEGDIGITISKDGGLPSYAVETGQISETFLFNGFPQTFGCFLLVHDVKRLAGLRYGKYEAYFDIPIFRQTFPQYADYVGYTFVKPKSGNAHLSQQVSWLL